MCAMLKMFLGCGLEDSGPDLSDVHYFCRNHVLLAILCENHRVVDMNITYVWNKVSHGCMLNVKSENPREILD